MTQTYSNERTFTVTNAKYIASKVAADLKRVQRFYNAPNDSLIQSFELELVEFLKNGVLDSVTYGFQRNGQWIEPTLKYKAQELFGITTRDDDPGSIKPNADVTGASFCSYLNYNDSWARKTESERNEFYKNLPFIRTNGSEPSVKGYLSNDLTYSSGDRALSRASVKNS